MASENSEHEISGTEPLLMKYEWDVAAAVCMEAWSALKASGSVSMLQEYAQSPPILYTVTNKIIYVSTGLHKARCVRTMQPA